MAKKSKTTFIHELEIRYRKKRVQGKTILGKEAPDPAKVFQLFSDLQNETKEKLLTIALDAKLKIIFFEVVAMGSLTSIYARPIEIIRTAIPWNPHGIILVHNHPSGDPKPSKEDKKATKEIAKYYKGLGVTLHDHVIIGDGDYFSFSQAGLIK